MKSRALQSYKTPFHIWKKSTPNFGHERVFGCSCLYNFPKLKVQKLNARGQSSIFVGFAEKAKAYKTPDLETKKVVISRYVTFD